MTDMNARDLEQALIERCAQAARLGVPAQTALEASVYRLAAMVLGTQLADAAAQLLKTSDQYFTLESASLLSPATLLQQRTVASLPRFKSMLTERLLAFK